MLETLSKQYTELQERISQAAQAQGQLSAQEIENKFVLEELENLEDDAQVFKLVGSVLAKQEKDESIENVQKRLALIAEELERLQKTTARNKEELDQLVAKLQKLQPAAANA